MIPRTPRSWMKRDKGSARACSPPRRPMRHQCRALMRWGRAPALWACPPLDPKTTACSCQTATSNPETRTKSPAMAGTKGAAHPGRLQPAVGAAEACAAWHAVCAMRARWVVESYCERPPRLARACHGCASAQAGWPPGQADMAATPGGGGAVAPARMQRPRAPRTVVAGARDLPGCTPLRSRDASFNTLPTFASSF